VAGFDIDGVEELRSLARDLDMTSTAVRGKAKDAVRKAAFSVERGAKIRAPVDTGNLRNSINVSLFGSGLSAGDTIGAEVGPEASYGVHQELGTWKMAPQPYLGPAFDEVEPSFIAALEALSTEVGE
jgi:HK97 gp10 family phage protein